MPKGYKDYDTVIRSVKTKLKCNSMDHTMGYIYALVDWWVISTKTFERLEDFIKK